jgi:glycosyltransferase involved in cell wall biosynthesis
VGAAREDRPWSMRKRRVAHVINSMGLGGVPPVVYHLLRALPAERYDCHLYVLARKADHQDVREAQLERFRELGVPVCFPERDRKDLHVVAELCQWIIRDQIDILHTHSYRPNIFGRLAGVLCKAGAMKIVGHYHNQYDNKWEADGTLIYDQLLARLSDRLIACSASVRQHIAEKAEIPEEQIELLLNGVELDRFAARLDPDAMKAELGIPSNSKVVGVVGRISEQKAQDDFIRAARIIEQDEPETVFLIVGAANDPALLERLQRLTIELGVDEKVRFVGHVTDMPRIYAALDVLVLPSRWEGFGLVLVEAMAAGKPIVATRVGGIPEVVVDGETALLVPPSDPAAIAAAVVSLLTDPERARAMGRCGVERAGLFAWKHAADRLDDLYSRLLNGDSR